MADDDYEIISQRELRRLKTEVGALKHSGQLEGGKLQDSIENLTNRLDSMIDVFEAAAEDMRDEDRESDLISQKIDPIFERLSQMEEQNKKIADGLVAINSIVDEKLTEFTDMAEALNRQQNELVEKLNDMMEDQRRPSIPSFPEHSYSAPPQASKPLPPSSNLPPLPSSPGLQKLEPSKKKKGFHLF